MVCVGLAAMSCRERGRAAGFPKIVPLAACGHSSKRARQFARSPRSIGPERSARPLRANVEEALSFYSLAKPRGEFERSGEDRLCPGRADLSPRFVTEKLSCAGRPAHKFRARRLRPLMAGSSRREAQFCRRKAVDRQQAGARIWTASARTACGREGPMADSPDCGHSLAVMVRRLHLH